MIHVKLVNVLIYKLINDDIKIYFGMLALYKRVQPTISIIWKFLTVNQKNGLSADTQIDFFFF